MMTFINNFMTDNILQHQETVGTIGIKNYVWLCEYVDHTGLLNCLEAITPVSEQFSKSYAMPGDAVSYI